MEKLKLTKKDKEIFFSELNNPLKPNKALKDAVVRFKKLLKSKK
jgi:uncharacterized protein (DUF1778 family)